MHHYNMTLKQKWYETKKKDQVCENFIISYQSRSIYFNKSIFNDCVLRKGPRSFYMCLQPSYTRDLYLDVLQIKIIPIKIDFFMLLNFF